MNEYYFRTEERQAGNGTDMYEKVIDTDSGSRERRTAYEISVQLINRKERAGNES